MAFYESVIITRPELTDTQIEVLEVIELANGSEITAKDIDSTM